MTRCAVYIIRCVSNGRIYVGSSRDVEQRRRNHFTSLRGGYHDNVHLQRAWNRHGAESFAFEVVEYATPGDLISVEQKYIDAAFDSGLVFNINRCASTRPPLATEKEREVASKFAVISDGDWRTRSNVDIAKQLGVAIQTAASRRPADIPSPGASSSYLSAATKRGRQRSPAAAQWSEERRRRAQEARTTRQACAVSTRWEAIKRNPVLTCSECRAQFVVLRLGKATAFCSDACYWRDEARRKAPQRAAHKRRRRAEAT